MIAKSCPKCELQVAVASKSCKCGHTFFAARRGADCLPAVEDIRRRTGRVRRSQPQFYDAQHYQKQIKRRLAPAVVAPSVVPNDPRPAITTAKGLETPHRN
ncbi:hypothetical protein HF086_017268 [Spodoptera exigua]|uniref:UPF0547 domain-containing protein n=1 Tax=Spodoptera exigua TaxID=7107 RepID=A0A922S7Y7_SPOEX|nr:hypothetical protein HF086_017268 [Spodoptera exigua]